ncbi:MAG: TatD family nuclease-associated radical SAM protein [Candidatus Margulisiibacteriota bacterium]
MSDIAYQIGDSLYLNITNRCTNECPFCIRNKGRQFNQQYDLWLNKEPTVDEIMAAIGDPAKYEQIVFCGYGEPTIRLDIIKTVTAEFKSKLQTSNIQTKDKSQLSNLKNAASPIIRLDTNGTANLFWGRNILPELKGLIDFISISLNAENAEKYNKLCRPMFGEQTYAAVLDFIRTAKSFIPVVEATIVDLPGVDKEACRKVAKELGASFRVRPYYEESYVK